MRMVLLSCLALTCGGVPALSDTIVAARTIRAQTVIMPSDIEIAKMDIPDGVESVSAAVGMEARVILYAGRPIRHADIGPPALVERNQVVSLLYRQGGLTIATEGRALGRAGAGDTLRVLNLVSRTTVSGTVGPDGRVLVIGSSLSR